MKRKLSLTCGAVMLALVTALAGTAFAQTQTGNITGKVTDNTGARAPGVTVTLSSPVLISPKTATTDAEGVYRFAALPPGTYALSFELQGFRKVTRTNVPVNLAQTLAVNASLEVGNLSESVEVVGAPLVDVTQTNVATNLDDNALQKIPTARDVWAILQNMAPQVVLNREDVGGSQGGLQAVFSTHGSSWHQNTYAMNGVNVTDPAATGALPFDLDWTEQWVFKVGAQASLTPALRARAGWNYGKSPLRPGRALENIVFPAIAEHHLTAGLGWDVSPSVTLNVGGTYAPEVSLSGSNAALPAQGGQAIASYTTRMSQYAIDLGASWRL